MLRPHAYTCVGLSLELMRRWQCLESWFPGLGAATGLLSCEESAPGVLRDSVSSRGPYELIAPDKEHVMVGIRISINGRLGVMIADPGYHVSKVVTVMEDNSTPNSGWFNQDLDGIQRKDFNYCFCKHNPNYVVWHEEERRNDVSQNSRSLIYVTRPFCDAVCVTEKRNLVYKYKSLVARSHMGKVTAGICFCLCSFFEKARFTIILEEKRIKYLFKIFRGPVNSDILDTIELCNTKLNFPEGRLITVIYHLSEILSDELFVRQCIQLSAYISQCSI